MESHSDWVIVKKEKVYLHIHAYATLTKSKKNSVKNYAKNISRELINWKMREGTEKTGSLRLWGILSSLPSPARTL